MEQPKSIGRYPNGATQSVWFLANLIQHRRDAVAALQAKGSESSRRATSNDNGLLHVSVTGTQVVQNDLGTERTCRGGCLVMLAKAKASGVLVKWGVVGPVASSMRLTSSAVLRFIPPTSGCQDEGRRRRGFRAWPRNAGAGIRRQHAESRT